MSFILHQIIPIIIERQRQQIKERTNINFLKNNEVGNNFNNMNNNFND